MNYSDVLRDIEQGTADERLPVQVVGVMSEVAEGRRELAAIRHPLGFLCLPLQRCGEYGLCVHVWTADQPEPDLTTSPMHCHSWDLVSYVLYGEVRNQLVHVTDDEQDPTYRVFEVHSQGRTDEIRPTGRLVRHEPGAEQCTAAGGVYSLPAGEFHMTVVPEAVEAATVVLGRGRPGTADLSLGDVHTGTHQVSRRTCARRDTACTARRIAHRVTARLARSGGRSG